MMTSLDDLQWMEISDSRKERRIYSVAEISVEERTKVNSPTPQTHQAAVITVAVIIIFTTPQSHQAIICHHRRCTRYLHHHKCQPSEVYLWWIEILFDMRRPPLPTPQPSRFPCCVLSYFSLVFVMVEHSRQWWLYNSDMQKVDNGYFPKKSF